MQGKTMEILFFIVIILGIFHGRNHIRLVREGKRPGIKPHDSIYDFVLGRANNNIEDIFRDKQ